MNFNELKSSVSLEEPITNKNKKTKDNEKTKPNREGVRQATVRLQAFHYVLSDDSWHFPHKSSSNKIKVNVVHRKQKKRTCYCTIQVFYISGFPTSALTFISTLPKTV